MWDRHMEVKMKLMKTVLFSQNSFFSVLAVEESKWQKQWRTVQPGDLKVFFALHVAMGLVHKPALKSYWSKDLVTQTPFFGEHMSLNSFELISQKTHFDNDSQNPAPSQANHDPLAKVRHIVSTLQHTFCMALSPNRVLGLNEATCAFHGVCRFHAFNPNKPDKYHLKLYAVSEVYSGYCLGFKVSTGQERKADPANMVVGWPSVVSPVWKHHGISDDSMLKFGAVLSWTAHIWHLCPRSSCNWCINIACLTRAIIYTQTIFTPALISPPLYSNRTQDFVGPFGVTRSFGQ